MPEEEAQVNWADGCLGVTAVTDAAESRNFSWGVGSSDHFRPRFLSERVITRARTDRRYIGRVIVR